MVLAASWYSGGVLSVPRVAGRQRLKRNSWPRSKALIWALDGGMTLAVHNPLNLNEAELHDELIGG